MRRAAAGALASMERATEHLCNIAESGDGRCTNARDRVKEGVGARVHATMPGVRRIGGRDQRWAAGGDLPPPPPHQKIDFRSFSPRFSIDWIVPFTRATFSSITASSSSGSPSKESGSPK